MSISERILLKNVKIISLSEHGPSDRAIYGLTGRQNGNKGRKMQETEAWTNDI